MEKINIAQLWDDAQAKSFILKTNYAIKNVDNTKKLFLVTDSSYDFEMNVDSIFISKHLIKSQKPSIDGYTFYKSRDLVQAMQYSGENAMTTIGVKIYSKDMIVKDEKGIFSIYRENAFKNEFEPH